MTERSEPDALAKMAASLNAEVLTLDQAASLLQLCSHTVSKLARKGDLPGRRIGREWRFVRSELLRWINGYRPS
jgi:excisionase family DNA binding protein